MHRIIRRKIHAARLWRGRQPSERSEWDGGQKGMRGLISQVRSIIHVCLEKIFSTSFSCIFFFFLPQSYFFLPVLLDLLSVFLYLLCHLLTFVYGCSCMTWYPFPESLTGRGSEAIERLGLNGVKHLSPPNWPLHHYYQHYFSSTPKDWAKGQWTWLSGDELNLEGFQLRMRADTTQVETQFLKPNYPRYKRCHLVVWSHGSEVRSIQYKPSSSTFIVWSVSILLTWRRPDL